MKKQKGKKERENRAKLKSETIPWRCTNFGTYLIFLISKQLKKSKLIK